MEKFNWSVTDVSDSAEAVAIHEALRDHVAAQVGPSHRKDLTIALKGASGDLLGGLRGFSHWQWLYISHLWVERSGKIGRSRSEAYRESGGGSSKSQPRRNLCRYIRCEGL